MAPARHPTASPQLTVEVAPAYEFLMGLATMSQTSDAETFEVGPGWLASTGERAGADLVDRVRAVSQGSSDTWIHLVPLAYAASAPRDVPAFLDHLRGTDAEEIRLRVLDYYARETQRNTPPEVIRRAVAGDPAARDEYLRTSHPEWEPWQTYLRHHLEQESESYKAELVAVLDAWAARVWPAEAESVMPILARDVDEKRSLADRLPIERFIETATNGVEFVAHPGVRRVVLIPTFAHRPWVAHVDLADTFFLIYPVSDESVAAGTDAPPLRLVRLSKALGDEKRLRVLRALADGEKTLMELAELFGVPKTTMHHHMIQLRSAGLVSVRAGTKHYRLRHEMLPDIGALLSGYLGAAAGPSATSGAPAPPDASDRVRVPAAAGARGHDRRTRVRTRA